MRDNLRNMQMVHLGKLTLSGTTTLKSALADLQDFNEATLVLVTQTVTDAGAAAGFTASLMHGDDTTDAGLAAAVTADSVDGVITLSVTADGDDDKLIGGMGYVGGKRYAGLNIVGTTGTDAVVEVYAIVGGANRLPTTFVGASAART